MIVFGAEDDDIATRGNCCGILELIDPIVREGIGVTVMVDIMSRLKDSEDVGIDTIDSDNKGEMDAATIDGRGAACIVGSTPVCIEASAPACMAESDPTGIEEPTEAGARDRVGKVGKETAGNDDKELVCIDERDEIETGCMVEMLPALRVVSEPAGIVRVTEEGCRPVGTTTVENDGMVLMEPVGSAAREERE